jgi:HD-like signal output (HDOD) protein
MKSLDNRAVPIAAVDPGAFMRKLMLDLAMGEIHLPSFPDIAVRVQKVLEDPRSAPSRVAVVVSSEAALAARILRLANSAFLNPSGEHINDLRIALTRLGVQLVRCTAVSFALQQMQFGVNDAAMKSRLRELWRNGALVAAIAHVLARETKAANPDEALLTGLMHNIGQIYIASNAPRGIEDDAPTWNGLINESHPKVAVAILRHWKFPSATIDALAGQNTKVAGEAAAGLADVLVAAILLVPCVSDREALPGIIDSAPAFKRLKLTAASCTHILHASAEQIRSLRAGLFD